MAQQQLTTVGGDPSRGLNTFFYATVHDKATNFIDNYQSLGFVFKGPFDARTKDDIGVGISRLHVNEAVRDQARLLNQVNGATDYDDPAFLPIQSTEYNSEIYYGIYLTDWLTVRPNLQYVVHPGGTDHVDNALVAGIKLQTRF